MSSKTEWVKLRYEKIKRTDDIQAGPVIELMVQVNTNLVTILDNKMRVTKIIRVLVCSPIYEVCLPSKVGNSYWTGEILNSYVRSLGLIIILFIGDINQGRWLQSFFRVKYYLSNTPTNHSHGKPRSIRKVHKRSFWFSIRGVKNVQLL